ncbi:MAG: hypothetical protein K0S04_2814 [Herbinix sp.]|nr:hypothetical protein [Herbinix sp.]
MKYMSELISGRFCRSQGFGLIISGCAKYISEYTYAKSAMALVEQESVFYILGYEDVDIYRKKCKAFKGVTAWFSF